MTSQTTGLFGNARENFLNRQGRKQEKHIESTKKNPYHPGLHFMQTHSTRAIFSLRITKDYRVSGVQQHKQMIWFWRGQHNPSLQQIKEKIRSC